MGDRRVNSHFYGIGVRDTPKILKKFFGVLPKILNTVRVLPGAAKRFCLPPQRGSGRASAASQREAKPLGGTREKLSFSNCWAKPI